MDFAKQQTANRQLNSIHKTKNTEKSPRHDKMEFYIANRILHMCKNQKKKKKTDIICV